MKNHPNLIIAGVPKSGTTSLHHYLSEHAEVCASSKKETFFWNRNGHLDQPDLELYESYFTHCAGQKIVLESTPRYYYDLHQGPSKLKSHLGEDLRVILVFRDPIQRLFSYFKFKKRSLEIPAEMRFSEYIEKCVHYNPDSDHYNMNALNEGFYDEYFQSWNNAFGGNQLVLFIEEFKEPKSLLKKVSVWLGINGAFYDSYEFVRENQSIDYKNKGLHQLGIKFFRAFEKTLNSVPAVRKGLTSIYYKLNGQPFKDEITQKDRDRLEELYAESNRQFKTQLIEAGVEIPDKCWLNNY